MRKTFHQKALAAWDLQSEVLVVFERPWSKPYVITKCPYEMEESFVRVLYEFSHTKTLLERGNTNKIRCLLKKFSSNLSGAFRRTWSCLRCMYHHHRISYLGKYNYWKIILYNAETDQWNFGISQLYFTWDWRLKY